MSLRSKTLRLAHDNPELRPKLSPLLKKGARSEPLDERVLADFFEDRSTVLQDPRGKTVARRLDKAIEWLEDEVPIRSLNYKYTNDGRASIWHGVNLVGYIG